jgi:hypothetical protein
MTSWLLAEQWRARGFRLFPVIPGTRQPALAGWQQRATDDASRVAQWWNSWQYGLANIGVALGNPYHVLDIDVKKGKNGVASFLKLGLEFDTLTVRTPSGGYHLYYEDAENYGNRVDIFKKDGLTGLDFRSQSGLVLAPGSYADGAPFTLELDLPIKPLPEVLKQRLRPTVAGEAEILAPLDMQRSIQDATHYLLHIAPASIEGSGGNSNAFQVAARLTHDYALSEGAALQLMLEHWNNRCMPPWSVEELEGLVKNGAAYGRGSIGSKSSAAMTAGLVAAPQLPAVQAATPAECGSMALLRAQYPGFGEFGNFIPAEQRQPRRWVVKNLIHRGDTSVMIAPGGVGKSTIALTWAAHIAAGAHLAPGWETKQRGKVLVMNLEDTRDTLSERLEALCGEYGLNPRIVIPGLCLVTAEDFPFRLTLDSRCNLNMDHINLLIEKVSNPEVVAAIYDPLVLVHDADEKDNGAMARVMRALLAIGRTADIGQLIVHHVTKPSRAAPLEHGNADAARGAGAIIMQARHSLTLFPLARDEAEEHGIMEGPRKSYARLQVAKSNIAPSDTPPLYFKKKNLLCGEDTTPVFKLHEFQDRTLADQRELAAAIYQTMQEQHTGEVLAKEVIEVWRRESPLRACMEDDSLQRLITKLPFIEPGLIHIDPHGRTLKFTRTKSRNRVVFVEEV